MQISGFSPAGMVARESTRHGFELVHTRFNYANPAEGKGGGGRVSTGLHKKVKQEGAVNVVGHRIRMVLTTE